MQNTEKNYSFFFWRFVYECKAVVWHRELKESEMDWIIKRAIKEYYLKQKISIRMLFNHEWRQHTMAK